MVYMKKKMIWLQRMIGMSRISFRATILLLEQASVVCMSVLFRDAMQDK